jgi:hypothetical protein
MGGGAPLPPHCGVSDVQRLIAKCSERCGWTGTVQTGWIETDAAFLARAQVPEDRRKERGGRLYYRKRLRDSVCPSCGVIGLDRAERLSERVRERVTRQIFPAGTPPRVPRWPL